MIIKNGNRDIKILDTYWFSVLSHGRHIGVVAIKTHLKESWKAYMGIVEGKNFKDDLMKVIDYGHALNKNQAIGFFPRFKNKVYSMG